jgi:hypothetical protein
MDDEQCFRQLGLRAFSDTSLRLLGEAIRKIQSRYPATIGWSGSPLAPLERHRADGAGPIPLISADWLRYVSEADHPGSGSPMALGEYISEEAISDSLKLLRQHIPAHAHITEIRRLDKGSNEIEDEEPHRATVIPYRDGRDWAFAVAYPDCVHWYDSRRSARLPCLSTGDRPLLYGWTPPGRECGNLADSREDSGLFMLMGIRCIYQGAPPLDLEAAAEMSFNFRARLAVELACRTVDPSEEEFRNLVPEPGEEEESLFLGDTDAGGGVQHDTPDQMPTAAGTLPYPLSEAPAGGPVEDRARQEQIFLRDRRRILDFLAEAALARRSMQAHLPQSLAVLWELVQREHISSALHARYHAVLLHDRMEGLGGEQDIFKALGSSMDWKSAKKKIKDIQKQCKFWSDVCKLRPGLEVTPQALLLSLPPDSVGGDAWQAVLLSNLQARLDDPNDRLVTYLKQAEWLCSAILFDHLPVDDLMIDNYRFKRPRDQELTDDDFAAFVDINPRARRAIPRL